VTGLTFERAWFSLPGYRPEGSFKGWLFTIAARALADHLAARPKGQVQVDSLSESLPDPAPGPEEAALRSEGVNEVVRVMELLAPEQREIIALRFLGELRYAEIAEITGKSEAAVKMAAYRALEELRRRCGDAPND
jgi:RNA polymerase sigma-70 factor (ECF subfamily)